MNIWQGTDYRHVFSNNERLPNDFLRGSMRLTCSKSLLFSPTIGKIMAVEWNGKYHNGLSIVD